MFARLLSRLYFIRKTSFKRRMFFYLLAVSVIPVLLLGGAASWIAATTVQQEVNRNHQIILTQIQVQVDELVKRLDQVAVHLASDELVIKAVQLGPSLDSVGNAMEMAEKIQKQRNYSDIPFHIALWLRDYQKVFTTWDGLISEDDFSSARYINLAPMNFISMTIIPPNSYPNQSEYLLIRPVPMFEEHPAGILVVRLDQNHITDIFKQANLGKHRKLLVVNGNGTIVASQQQSEVGSKLTSTSELYRFWNNPGDIGETLELGDKKYNLSAQRSTLNDWTYIALTPSKELKEKSNYILNMTWGFIGILIVLWLIVVFISSNRLYIPIQRLTSKLSGGAMDEKAQTGDGLKEIDSYIQHMVVTNDQLQSVIGVLFPRFQESLLLGLLRGELSEQEIFSHSKLSELPISSSMFFVCLAEIDGYSDFSNTYNVKDRSLLHFAFRKMIEEQFANHFEVLTAAPMQGQVAAVIGLEHPTASTDEQLRRIGRDILKFVAEFFSFGVSLAISSAHKGYPGIHKAGKEAEGLLSYRLMLGTGRMIAPEDIAPDLKQSRYEIVKRQKLIIESISGGDLQAARTQLAELADTVVNNVRDSNTVRGLFSHLLGELEFLMQSLGHDTVKEFERDPYRELHEMTSIEEIVKWFDCQLFPEVINRLQSPGRQTTLVHQAILYVRDHLESDISLQLVADEIEVSTSHLSKVFKDITGQNFVEYVIECRMKLAMKWLAQTDVPIKEIADRIRYTNVQNFARTFKQYAQMPPGQYRNRFRS
ncbi:AraC family transcriptional regulator [Paenibacillus agaridevorans]|uniref:AraC family transcriptional regulator n=1 Tax=Paenibacillus agaridevorans TaxID=171404 RepID=A0A2R5EQU2_9BACL|nr:AraC family transcriptional regulator [Paenibacillus agaridevorans]GBG05791.1 AraC family transcriptional regulator [Paenibacillus agaridevorans]